MSADLKPLPRVDCCFVGCEIPALARVFTNTGWANVCTEHYPQLRNVPRVSHSVQCEAIRKGYKRREPGSDDE